jgi:alcohol dehydrogenase, propanol-preferring
MLAMIFDRPGAPLRAAKLAVPRLGPTQILIRVYACGVCRTDLHVVDGELPKPKLPLVLGHEIVGKVVERGDEARRFAVGDRVGVPWLGKTCGVCSYCRSNRENLCDSPQFTGYTLDGGYAEFTAADERYCFAIPSLYTEAEAAPLMCAGLIGYRSLVLAGEARRLGIYGFGAAAHLIAQVAMFQGRKVFAFTRPGDHAAQDFARRVGAVWAGDSTSLPPEPLDAAIIYAPIGSLVPSALAAMAKGGTVVSAGIHMSDIPSFPYDLLWGERVLRSVANLTRRDGVEFFSMVEVAGAKATVMPFALEEANHALDALRSGDVEGAAVLVPQTVQTSAFSQD